jgi:hypothetical protein
MLTRRSFLSALASLVTAPALVRADSIMPVKAWVEPEPETWGTQLEVCGQESDRNWTLSWLEREADGIWKRHMRVIERAPITQLPLDIGNLAMREIAEKRDSNDSLFGKLLYRAKGEAFAEATPGPRICTPGREGAGVWNMLLEMGPRTNYISTSSKALARPKFEPDHLWLPKPSVAQNTRRNLQSSVLHRGELVGQNLIGLGIPG